MPMFSYDKVKLMLIWRLSFSSRSQSIVTWFLLYFLSIGASFAQAQATNTFECTSIVKDGDAKTGNTASWQPFLGGEITMHHFDINEERTAYKHSGRAGINSGPGQYINPSCFEEGKEYRFTALIQLSDSNGIPYACNTHEWRNPLTCPLFSIKYQDRESERWMYMNAHDPSYTSDRDGVLDKVKPYEVIFEAPPDLNTAIEAYFVIRAPPKESNILYNDMSLTRLVPTASPSEEPFLCEGVCCEMVTDGYADTTNRRARDPVWDPVGEIVVNSYGPNRNSKSYMHTYGSDIGSGPGQYVNPECFLGDKEYKFTAQMRLYDSSGIPYACNTNERQDPLSCPFFGIRYRLPSGIWRWVSVHNPVSIKKWSRTSYTPYDIVFKAPTDFSIATEAHFVIRGLPRYHTIEFDGASLTPYKHNPVLN